MQIVDLGRRMRRLIEQIEYLDYAERDATQARSTGTPVATRKKAIHRARQSAEAALIDIENHISAIPAKDSAGAAVQLMMVSMFLEAAQTGYHDHPEQLLPQSGRLLRPATDAVFRQDGIDMTDFGGEYDLPPAPMPANENQSPGFNEAPNIV